MAESYPSGFVITTPRPEGSEANMLYEITIHKALGGRNVRDQFSNSYFINSNDAIESSALRDDMDAIVAAERLITTSAIQFMRAHMRHKADNILNAPPKTFVTKELDVQGSRVPPNVNADLLPLDLCVMVKRDTETGRAGKLFMRGCLYSSDGDSGIGGGYTLDPAGDFATGPGAAFVAALNAPLPSGAEFILPEVAGLIYQGSRPILTHRLGGIVVLKRNRSRTSVGQAEKNWRERKANELAREAASLLGGGTVADLAGPFLVKFQALAAELAPLIPFLTAGFLARFPVAAPLRLLMLAAPR